MPSTLKMRRTPHMVMEILGKKLLFLTAHPDDESYLAAGTILANGKMGGTTYIACATFGEKGKSQLTRPVSARALKKMRRIELQRVSKALGVTKLFTLKLPDGELSAHHKTLYTHCLKIARKVRPEAIISFGPDGISRHLDHIAIGKEARRVAKRLQLPFLAFARPPRIAKHEHLFTARRRHGVYANTKGYAKPNVKIAVNPKQKLKVIRLHKSQLKERRPLPGMPGYAVREVLCAEYFVRM